MKSPTSICSRQRMPVKPRQASVRLPTVMVAVIVGSLLDWTALASNGGLSR
ncbi:hypothetical protein [Streptomyces sasae]|uniref:hypothetical protein n=1 Tax=Streptomyces sasae TaxID=1266772 RepID=UPI00292DAC6B|nr:hypothetical protein [Streptomyces sasae]